MSYSPPSALVPVSSVDEQKSLLALAETLPPKEAQELLPFYGPELPSQEVGGIYRRRCQHLTGHIQVVGQSAAEQADAEFRQGVSQLKRANKGVIEEAKKKRIRNDDPSSDDYLGPWAPYEEEVNEKLEMDRQASGPVDPDVQKFMEDLLPGSSSAKGSQQVPSSSRAAEKLKVAEPEVKEVVTSIFHGKSEFDYQGKSWLEPPPRFKQPVAEGDNKTFIPRKHVHTFIGHSKGINRIKFFPKTGHVLLSCSMDGTCKIWDASNKKTCLRTYMGHDKAIKDVNFTPDGRHFVSAGFDCKVVLWDTETGKVVQSMTNGKMPLCVTVHPDPAEEHSVIIGCANQRAVQFDTRSGEIVQEYCEHLAKVNTVTFIDNNRKICTTGDDKKIFIWEYGIPVVVKHIAEPNMHAIPAVTLHPEGKFFAGQSMDNQIVVYEAVSRFRFQGKKRFRGHQNSGYGILPGFSPDGAFIMSGDAQGRCWYWEWKTMRNFRTIQCHDGVCMSSVWHPTHPSLVATCGWDGLIKLWD